MVTLAGTAPCTLIDLSRGGLRLAASDSPQIGAMLLVEGFPVELFGSVRWAIGGVIGCAFLIPIPLERVVALRHYADGEAERQHRAQLAHARNWVQGVR